MSERARGAARPLRCLGRVAAAAVLAVGGVVAVGGQPGHAAGVLAEPVPVVPHLNACFPEPALPATPYLGPAIDDALLYSDWIARVIAEHQGCDLLRVPTFGELRLPLADPVTTSKFGLRYHPIRRRWLPHPGVDLVDRERRWRVPVLAAGNGTVIATGDFAAYGYSVVIDHGDRVATVYTHLASIRVRKGATVDAGDRVGRLGSSGAVTGPHLHFELRLGAAAVDPLDYIAPWPTPPEGAY